MEPYYPAPVAGGYDPYYLAMHNYSAEVTRSAKEEIEKQAQDLKNFRKVMLSQELENEKLKSVSSKLHTDITRMVDENARMKTYMEELEAQNAQLKTALDDTSKELQGKHEKSLAELQKAYHNHIKLIEDHKALTEKFMRLQAEFDQQKRETENLASEKERVENAMRNYESSTNLQMSENEKLRAKLKREREQRILLEDWEKKRLYRLAMYDPLVRPIAAPLAGTYYPRPVDPLLIPPAFSGPVPTSDVLTKLKLLETELQAEADNARSRSARIADGWGGGGTAGGSTGGGTLGGGSKQ